MAKKVAIAGCRRRRNFIGPVTRSTMLCAMRAIIGSIAVFLLSDRHFGAGAKANGLPSLPPETSSRRSHRFYAEAPTSITESRPLNSSEGLHDKTLFHASSAVH